jgi:glycosyltransferase involved in cell wall biosynthesis
VETDQLSSEEITIISVTKNDHEGIRRTVESVLEQDFLAWKLIIVLSSASDSSYDYAQQLCRDHANIHYLIPDSLGIYLGMNFALDKFETKLTWFLNGGDAFLNEQVLSCAYGYMVRYKPSVLIGGYAILENGTRKVFSRHKAEITARRFSLNIRSGNHQAMLFNFSDHEKPQFNLDLELAADFLLVLEKLKHKPALRIPEVFVEVEPGGVSSTYIEKVWIEKQSARKMAFGKYSPDSLLGIIWTCAVRFKRFTRTLINSSKEKV